MTLWCVAWSVSRSAASAWRNTQSRLTAPLRMKRPELALSVNGYTIAVYISDALSGSLSDHYLPVIINHCAIVLPRLPAIVTSWPFRSTDQQFIMVDPLSTPDQVWVKFRQNTDVALHSMRVSYPDPPYPTSIISRHRSQVSRDIIVKSECCQPGNVSDPWYITICALDSKLSLISAEDVAWSRPATGQPSTSHRHIYRRWWIRSISHHHSCPRLGFDTWS